MPSTGWASPAAGSCHQNRSNRKGLTSDNRGQFWLGLANAADIAAAAAAAKRAQPDWAAQPGPQRAALMRRAARVLEDNRAEFERWLVREGGAIPGKAAFEVDLVLGELWEAAALPTQPVGQLLPTSEAGRQSIARRIPVAPIIVVKDTDEAIRVANDTEYGLVAAIQTGSLERGLQVAEQLHTGIVHVNDQTLDNDAFAPFGGTGASGNGSRFGSQSSLDGFTQWQWVASRPQARGFPF